MCLHHWCACCCQRTTVDMWRVLLFSWSLIFDGHSQWLFSAWCLEYRQDFWAAQEHVPFLLQSVYVLQMLHRNQVRAPLYKTTPPIQLDKFWQVCDMIMDNQNMDKCFGTSWAICLTEACPSGRTGGHALNRSSVLANPILLVMSIILPVVQSQVSCLHSSLLKEMIILIGCLILTPLNLVQHLAYCCICWAVVVSCQVCWFGLRLLCPEGSHRIQEARALCMCSIKKVSLLAYNGAR